jgi:hypothetical protein
MKTMIWQTINPQSENNRSQYIRIYSVSEEKTGIVKNNQVIHNRAETFLRHEWFNNIELEKNNKFQPEHPDCAEDRPYSREKIQRLLEIAQQRDRAIYFVDGLIRNKGRFYSRTTHKKLGDNRKVRNILNHGLPKVKFKVYYFFALLKHPGR